MLQAGGITILDTRKTTPTLRVLGTVRRARGRWHRITNGRVEASRIHIKDNHIRLGGGVAADSSSKMKASRQEMPIEIEAQSLEQVDEAVAAHADVILVDNSTDRETCVRQFAASAGAPRSSSPAA